MWIDISLPPDSVKLKAKTTSCWFGLCIEMPFAAYFGINIFSLTLDIERYMFWCNADDTYCYGNEDQRGNVGSQPESSCFSRFHQISRISSSWKIFGDMYHVIYDSIARLIYCDSLHTQFAYLSKLHQNLKGGEKKLQNTSFIISRLFWRFWTLFWGPQGVFNFIDTK